MHFDEHIYLVKYSITICFVAFETLPLLLANTVTLHPMTACSCKPHHQTGRRELQRPPANHLARLDCLDCLDCLDVRPL